jgi:hypothetical protein
MSNARDHKLGIFLVALLAAASVRLDDIWYRRPLDAQLWPDWLIGAILAFSASVVLIGTLPAARVPRPGHRACAPHGGLADTADREPRRRDLGRRAWPSRRAASCTSSATVCDATATTRGCRS